MDRPDWDVSHVRANLNFDLHHAAAPPRRLSLEVHVLPKQADEFTCLRCHLAAHRSQQSKPGVSVCRDCASPSGSAGGSRRPGASLRRQPARRTTSPGPGPGSPIRSVKRLLRRCLSTYSHRGGLTLRQGQARLPEILVPPDASRSVTLTVDAAAALTRSSLHKSIADSGLGEDASRPGGDCLERAPAPRDPRRHLDPSRPRSRRLTSRGCNRSPAVPGGSRCVSSPPIGRAMSTLTAPTAGAYRSPPGFHRSKPR